MPAWRARGVEPVGWFSNPNIQPSSELSLRAESMRRFARVAGLALLVPEGGPPRGWERWAAGLADAGGDKRCRECLRLRLDATARAAATLGFRRFSTTLTVSPYQRHDLIVQAGEAAAGAHGVKFLYLDARPQFRDSHAESRRLDLYRQAYCGCAASKWEAWDQKLARRRAG